MKKVLLSASLIALSFFAAKAQDASEHKPVQGDVTTEFTYGGLFNSSQLGLNNGGLRFRYFVSDNLAGRLGMNVSSSSTTDNFLNGNEVGGTQKSSNSAIGLNLGVEKHFSGTERLSTYAGADLRVQLNSNRIVRENTNGAFYSQGSNSTIKTGSTGIGLRLVTGADYYFVKKVYLGGELGWGFLMTAARDTKITSGTDGNTTDTVVPATDDAKSFDLSPSVVGSIRLGFRF